MLTGSTDEEKIWNYLYIVVKNAYGVAGIMGNMKAESNLQSNNMEDAYQSRLGFTDETYTAAVDNGTYTNFCYDAVGYGLVQWTWSTIKKELYDLAKSKGTSVGDLETQLECFCNQLQTRYATTVWPACKDATSVAQASNAMLIYYENPAIKNYGTRASLGQTFYNKYAGTTVKGTVRICHAWGPEGGGVNGAAGDSTGYEVHERDWYNAGWSSVCRYEADLNIGYQVAQAAIKIANNNLTGYSQADRNSLYYRLKENNWDVDKFIESNVKTNTDCSAFCHTCYCLYMESLRDQIETNKNCYYSGNLRDGLVAHGFVCYTGSNYTASSENLKPGDVLIKSGHAAMVVDDGTGGTVYQQQLAEIEGAALEELIATVQSIEDANKETNLLISGASQMDSSLEGTYKINTANLINKQLSDRNSAFVIPKGTICLVDGSYCTVNNVQLLLIKYLINNKLYYTYCPKSYLVKVS